MSQSKLNRLVELLDGKRGECSCGCHLPPLIPEPGVNCCDHTGTIANEPAQRAWEVLTTSCRFCDGDGKERRPKPGGFSISGILYETEVGEGSCDHCIGVGHVPHDISTWPDSAVCGMLEQAILILDFHYENKIHSTGGASVEALLDGFVAAFEEPTATEKRETLARLSELGGG